MIKNLTMAAKVSVSNDSSDEDEDDGEVVSFEDSYPKPLYDSSREVKHIFGCKTYYEILESTNDMFEYIAKVGLIKSFSWGYLNDKNIKSDINAIVSDEKLFNKYKDIFCIQREWFNNIINVYKINVDNLPSLKSIVEADLNNLLAGDRDTALDFISNENNLLLKSIENNPESFDLKRILSISIWTYIIRISSERFAPINFSNIERVIKLLPKDYVAFAMKKICFDEFKHKTPFARGQAYSVFIKHGLLNKKTARKIRSEQSSQACMIAVETFFTPEIYSLYKNTEEILSTFQDVRHENVQDVIARLAPDDSIWRFVSFSSYRAKETLKRRMYNE